MGFPGDDCRRLSARLERNSFRISQMRPSTTPNVNADSTVISPNIVVIAEVPWSTRLPANVSPAWLPKGSSRGRRIPSTIQYMCTTPRREWFTGRERQRDALLAWAAIEAVISRLMRWTVPVPRSSALAVLGRPRPSAIPAAPCAQCRGQSAAAQVACLAPLRALDRA